MQRPSENCKNSASCSNLEHNERREKSSESGGGSLSAMSILEL